MFVFTCLRCLFFSVFIYLYRLLLPVYIYLYFTCTFTCLLQVQPDLDELAVDMEDNEDAESTKSEVKLGKLQFSLDYDFQKGEVSGDFNLG